MTEEVSTLTPRQLYLREWKRKNRERIREQERARYARDPQKALERVKRYQQTEKGKAANKRHKQSEKRQAWVKAYRRKANENTQRWYAKDLEQSRLRKIANQSRRRARMAEAGGTATWEQIAQRVAAWGWRCWLCREPWEAVDHVIPIAQGGTNWPANLRPICRSCNSRKGAKRLPLSA